MKLKNISVNAIILILSILATFYKMQWAENLMLFITPIILLIATAAFLVTFFFIDEIKKHSPEEFTKEYKNLSNKNLRMTNQLFYFSLVIVFVLNAWFVIATCWALTWFIAYNIRVKILAEAE